MEIIGIEKIGSLIKDGDTVAISGSGGSGSPEALLEGVRTSFLRKDERVPDTVCLSK